RGAGAPRRRLRGRTGESNPALGGAAGDDANGRADGAVLVADRRRRARLADRLPTAVPLLDGNRGCLGGAVRCPGRPRRPPRSARPAGGGRRAGSPPVGASPIRVVVDGGGPSAVSKVSSELRRERGIAAVGRPQRLSGGVTVIDSVSTSPWIAQASKDTVNRI